MADVKLNGISKTFPNGVEALSGVDLNVADGEAFAVVGPSGSGKSTLLRLIAGLDTASAGSIRIGGRAVSGLPPRERDVAMVFQNPALYPYLNVAGNLAFGLKARGVRRSEIRTRVGEIAEALGLSDVLRRRPQTLSGGQRQRVALGRAIVRRPAVFLFDEPMSSLDPPLRAAIRADLVELRRTFPTTMILVTHDQAEALALGDRVGLMEHGKLIDAGRPADAYERPVCRAVARFLGGPPMNVLLCEVAPGTQVGAPVVRLDGIDPDLAFALPAGDWSDLLGRRQVYFGVRPESVVVASPNDPPGHGGIAWLPGRFEVRRAEYHGHETVVELAIGWSGVNARVSGRATLAAGQACRVGFRIRDAVWFDANPDAPSLIRTQHAS